MHFIKALVKDVIEQSWTLLGMAIAWLVLEGSAKDLTLTLIGATLLVWIVTFPLFRYEKEEKKDTPAKKKPLKRVAFNFKAKDGDGDGVIQDGTIWERKAPKAKK
jgi:aspartyl-tRNA synthetase